jgi:hypothetical protein
LTNRQIQSLSGSHELTRVRRGAYLSTSAWDSLSADDKVVLRIAAIADALGPAAVISHTSAARLHSLPTGRLQLERPHATWPASRGRGASTNVVPHRSKLIDSDIVEVGGIQTTSIERTLLDIARAADVRLAVAMIDDALRRGLTTAARLDSTAATIAGRPGAGRVRQIFAFADGLSESVGESVTRVQLRQLGLPRPQLQALIVGTDHLAIGRVDFLIAELGTVIEFDGRVKYERLLRVGESASDVVYREKVREDALRATGLAVVRVIWRDQFDDASVLRRCIAAFERQGHPGWRPSAPALIGHRPRLV